MKKHRSFFATVFILSYVISSATNYYVDATLGNDTYSGKSAALAWKSLNKVSNAWIKGGDSVLFKRGETFRGNITAVKNGSTTGAVVYGAYGTGNKPILMGSVQKNQTGDWVNIGTNLWETSSALIDDVGNIIFNNEASCGIKVKAATALNGQGKFFSTTTFKVQMYSVSNPATFYTNIELAVTVKLIHLLENRYITFENLDLKYTGAQGIQGRANNNIWIKDCDFAYIGGGYLTGTTRYGNPVTFYGSNNNCIVERCTFRQAYDVAMSAQGDEVDNLVYNIYFRNNLVDKCEQSFEFWCRGANAQAHDIYFENNTCTNAGSGWSRTQRPDPNAVHLLFWGSDSTTVLSNIFIRNNIFSNAVDAGIFDSSKAYEGTKSSVITIDNNCWNVINQIAIQTGWDNARPGPTTTKYKAATYKTNTGNDAKSIFANPLLNSDNTLSSTSPCVNAGLSLPTVLTDFNKSVRPSAGSDIGAFESFLTSLTSSINDNYTSIVSPTIAIDKLTLNPAVITNNEILYVYSISGRLVMQLQLINSIQNIDISNLESGMYIVRLKSKPNMSSSFIKK